jgi:ribose 5-phosphate isomerase A
MNIEELKKLTGYKAAELIQKGTTVGLGTGTTAYYFIEKLIERNDKEQLNIKTVSSSKKSLKQAKEGGLSVFDIDEVDYIDITVDGADEIDPEKRMIKGGGGALLREKIVASMSKEMVVIIDESKQSPQLGTKKLPVEVTPFGSKSTLRKIQKRTPSANFRMNEKSPKELYITDNGNYIIDVYFKSPLKDPEKEHNLLKQIPGVIETGFFFHLAGRVIVAFLDGQLITLP